jgi:hypothetical protein
MAYRYYYTPHYSGPALDDAGDPIPDTSVTAPGQDTGSGAEYAPSMPATGQALKYDVGASRCVVRLREDVPPLAGWVQKTSGDVLTDYPGLPGVL